MREALDRITAIDWIDVGESDLAAREFLVRLADNRPLVRELFQELLQSPRLQRLSESSMNTVELVLFEAPHGRTQLRLVVDNSTLRDVPHHHTGFRTSIDLRGDYRHTFYGADGDEPEFMADEGPGVVYTLHPEAYHTVKTQGGTVSLTVQGISGSSPVNPNAFQGIEVGALRRIFDALTAEEIV